MKPVPTEVRPQVAAETLSVLDAAAAAIARAAGSLGRSIGGAGNGSNPTNTSGRPVESRKPPSSPAISVGGGRMEASVRTAVEPPAASARRGIGPAAIRLPASHTMSRAWTTPSPPPAIRSAVLSSPSPNRPAISRPMAAPSDSPRMTAPTRPMMTTIGRIVGSISDSWSATYGRARIAAAPPVIAPIRPNTCGVAPDRQPRTTATTMNRIVSASSGFTGRSSHRRPEDASGQKSGQPATTVRAGPPPVRRCAVDGPPPRPTARRPSTRR